LSVNEEVKSVIFGMAIAFFAWMCYWMYVDVKFATQLILERSFFVEQTSISWWTTLFYATEFTPSIGVAFRWIAAILVLLSALIVYTKKEVTLSMIKRKVCAALVLESFYHLTLIPAMISGFVFAFLGETLWYYGRTPPFVVVLVNGFVSLADLVTIPIALLILRFKIARSSSNEEILKWGCIAAVAYIFVLWFTYSMAWLASFIPWAVRAQPGITILLNPLDFISFAATMIGLLAVVIHALKTLLPAIRKKDKLNLKSISITMIGLGFYFVLQAIIYVLIGGYHAHPTVWMEILMPEHNPDFWCISFTISGIYLFTKYRAQRV
jgi:hypothetical protein